MRFCTFPPSVRGQSATSILRIVAESTSSADAKRAHNECLRRAAPILNSMPCRAGRFCQITEGTYGTPDELLRAHSLLNWKGMGLTSKDFQSLSTVLVEGTSRIPCPSVSPLLACMNRTSLVCPECARKDKSTHGYVVQYCAHCIDYVTRCDEHDELLVLESEGSFFEALFIQKGSHDARRNSQQYGRTALDLAASYSSGGLWQELVSLLKRKNFVTEEGRWRLQEFQSAAARFFSAGFEDARLTTLATSDKLWFGAVRAGTRGRHVHPVAATLMYIFATAAEPLSKHKPVSARNDSLSPAAPVLSEKRTAWQKLVESSPTQNRSQLIAREQGLSTWLYRHDFEWFASHQPPLCFPRGGRKSEPIPECVSVAILGTTTDPRARADGRPPLPSAYQMRIAYGMREHAFHLMVGSAGAAGETAVLPGSKEVFVARRVQWAFQTYGLGTWSATSVIAGKARIQPSTICRYAPAFVECEFV